MITLEKHNIKYLNDFVDFIKDFQTFGDEFDMLDLINEVLKYNKINKEALNLTEEEIKNFFPLYIDYIKLCQNQNTIPNKDWVEMDSYFICEDNKMIGEIRFRKKLTPYLLTRSHGHIGYLIRHSKRNKGYATKALNILINNIWKNYPHTELMITCNEDNIPSSRVIEKNGGILNRINRDFEIHKKEYWIFKN